MTTSKHLELQGRLKRRIEPTGGVAKTNPASEAEPPAATRGQGGGTQPHTRAGPTTPRRAAVGRRPAGVAPGDGPYHGGDGQVWLVPFKDGVTPYLLTSDETVAAGGGRRRHGHARCGRGLSLSRSSRVRTFGAEKGQRHRGGPFSAADGFGRVTRKGSAIGRVGHWRTTSQVPPNSSTFWHRIWPGLLSPT